MNWTLYKNGLKSSWKLWIIFCAVITMYFTIIVTMYDPKLNSILADLEKAMPQLMNMVGMSGTETTLVGFMSNYLYGFIMLIFPMVFAIIMGNSLVAKRVDSGSMAYLLSAPVSRAKIVFTQMKVLGTSVFLLVAYATVVGIAVCEVSFPGELAIGRFLLLNLGVLMLHLFISGICFLFSCIFNETKYSLSFGAGIPALGYIIQMIANAGEKLENAKYATFFTLFDSQGSLAGDSSAYLGMALLAAGGIITYVSANLIFIKKDIPV